MNNKINYKRIFFYFQKKLSFLFNIFFNLFFIYIFFIFILNITIKDHKKVLNFSYFNFYKVASNSMFPDIEKGNIVIIKKISDEECYNLKPSSSDLNKDGDIVVFKNENITNDPIIHRIIENNKENREIITLGDNNEGRRDESTSYDNIIGKHVYTIQKPYFLIFLLYFIIFLPKIIFFLLKKFQKKI
ncbi:MAG: signal peptidase I [Candidatus Phytoplasma stylosanthis]|uniref:signal peptidase I n=1 Tax=Candidatus Phytoplasma stylosanthis TaxID=2798314 RepID=UPI00293A32BB|nr:signal peptidase I [Candidatus Phytoplasma stylosanthis]MDV3168124.1 signal peptidase I [Candidatus Phytoplasma stylosanthis]MDV3171107.1 signal peptidase I [Candidatus Phytoplasma stylosanthis]MDV3174317.1 signal peptidase I [Candidatus Phytoplasma stylosanthis]MDV3202636.1 signal peptidase I [Candidatus Phytoplasma stylosanthis]